MTGSFCMTLIGRRLTHIVVTSTQVDMTWKAIKMRKTRRRGLWSSEILELSSFLSVMSITTKASTLTWKQRERTCSERPFICLVAVEVSLRKTMHLIA
mmetsp:Transcript_8626/g.15661  ORF Transcript_8626/g.15661 Transcript_8626/m.15661 type:complete len:98 (-) Transcript_8626:448-741(-)